MNWKSAVVALGTVGIVGSGVAAQGQGSPEPRQYQHQLLVAGGPRLGVTLHEVTAAEAREKKMTAGAVQVESVLPGSPAEKAGIKAGDVISEFDGEHVRGIAQLRRLLAETPAGATANVGLLRDGRKVELSVTPDSAPSDDLLGPFTGELRRRFGDDWLREWPRDPQVPQPHPPIFQWSPGAGRLGVVVQELTPQLAEYFGAKSGVLVASVSSDTPAARAGLKAGDVITAIDGKAVRSPEEIVRSLRELPDGQEVTVAAVRDRKALTLKVKLTGAKSPWHVAP